MAYRCLSKVKTTYIKITEFLNSNRKIYHELGESPPASPLSAVQVPIRSTSRGKQPPPHLDAAIAQAAATAGAHLPVTSPLSKSPRPSSPIINETIKEDYDNMKKNTRLPPTPITTAVFSTNPDTCIPSGLKSPLFTQSLGVTQTKPTATTTTSTSSTRSRKILWCGKVKEAAVVVSSGAASFNNGEFSFEGKERWLVMFQDYLILAKEFPGAKTAKTVEDVLGDEKLIIKRIIPLNHIRFKRPSDPPLVLSSDDVLVQDAYAKPDPHHTLVSNHPKTLAYLLLTSNTKSASSIGDILSNRPDILEGFLSWFNFKGIRLDVAFRCFCERFKIKSQGERWDLFADAFVRRYTKTNPELKKEDVQKTLSKMFVLNSSVRSGGGRNVPAKQEFCNGLFPSSSSSMHHINEASSCSLAIDDIYSSILYRPLELGCMNQRVHEFSSHRPRVERWFVPKYLIEGRPFSMGFRTSHPDPDYSIKFHGVGLDICPATLSFADTSHQLTITPLSSGTKVLMMTELYKGIEIVETLQSIQVVVPSWMDTSLQIEFWNSTSKTASTDSATPTSSLVVTESSLPQLGLAIDSLSVCFEDAESKKEFIRRYNSIKDTLDLSVSPSRFVNVSGSSSGGGGGVVAAVAQANQLRRLIKRLAKKTDELDNVVQIASKLP